jgi:ABC-type multidrug transport system ATPase subunit
MGPSGAGKTSLLNILAGRATTGGRIKVGCDIRLNNYRVDPTKIATRKLIAFVAQDDSLQVTSTPREAIMFSAKLRLPRSTTDSQLEKLTNRMISELGLTSCADTIVGGELIKGISGGERKRTSVGVELVTKVRTRNYLFGVGVESYWYLVTSSLTLKLYYYFPQPALVFLDVRTGC